MASSTTSQTGAAVATGGFGSVAPSPRAANGADDVRMAGFERRANAPVQAYGVLAPTRIDRPVEIVSTGMEVLEEASVVRFAVRAQAFGTSAKEAAAAAPTKKGT